MNIQQSLFTENKQINFIKELDKHFEYFPYNEEQLKFIESPLENSKLIGIPGGGKTQSILGKILYHYKQGLFTSSNEYIILTFSKKTSYEFLEKGIKIMGSMDIFNRKNIRTIHSLAGQIMCYQKENNNENENENNDNFSMEDTVILSSIFKLDQDPEYYKDMYELNNLKVIFIDEAQDISNIQYDFLCCISEHYKIPLILIGDPNQNIYQFQKGSDTYLLNHSDKTYKLIKNYRSTPEIIGLINFFRPWTKITPMMQCGNKKLIEKTNKKPVVFVGSIEEIMDDINKNLIHNEYLAENTAIIGPVKKSKPYNESYANIGLSLIVNNLQKNNIQYKKQYDDSKENGISSLEDTEFKMKREEGEVNLYTIHGSKGLEFDSVFLINFHTNTFGKVPTEEEYKEYKYLWYVGLSRAKYQLRIYIEQSKLPWYGLKMCPYNLYKVEGKKISFTRTLQFKEEIDPEYFVLKNLMTNKKYFDDEVFFTLEKILPYKIKKEKLFIENNNEIEINKNIMDYKDNNKFYGLYLKNIYMYFYDLKYKNENLNLTKTKTILENLVLIPKTYARGFNEIRKRFPNIMNNIIFFNDLYESKNKLGIEEDKLINYLYELFEEKLDKTFMMLMENEILKYPKDRLESSLLFLEVNMVENNKKREKEVIFDSEEEKDNFYNMIYKSIWEMSLFMYQIEEEINLWNYDNKVIMNDLKPYIINIQKLIERDDNETYRFNEQREHSKIPILTEIDLKDEKENKVILLKFSKNTTKKNVMELILQSYINDNKWKNPKIEIWNFYQGEKYIINMNMEQINKYLLLNLLSLALKKKLKNMIFIYDIEIENFDKKNGIPREIVQRHLQEIELELVISNGFVTPKYEYNKKNYYQKEKLLDADEVEDVKKEFESIFERCDNPLLISHNLALWDEDIFATYNIFNEKDGRFKKMMLVDSQELLSMYINKNLAESEIIDIYQHLFKKELTNTISENNVIMLKEILIHFGLDYENIKSLLEPN